MNNINEEDENPILEHIVSGLGFICLIALAIQTWIFIDWLMGPAEWWMKYMTLCFFDIFGGVWLVLGLFHTPPTQLTYQLQRTGVVVCFLLSAATTVAWCFIFITRTPLTPAAIAALVDTARWLIVFAVIFNAFLMIYYSAETNRYHLRMKHPTKKRWATEKYSAPTSSIQMGQTGDKPFIPAQGNKNRNKIASPSRNKTVIEEVSTIEIEETEGDEIEDGEGDKKKVKDLPPLERRVFLGGRKRHANK